MIEFWRMVRKVSQNNIIPGAREPLDNLATWLSEMTGLPKFGPLLFEIAGLVIVLSVGLAVKVWLRRRSLRKSVPTVAGLPDNFVRAFGLSRR